ncbi:hypothetical protein DVT68_14430 [Dyella solisilvae]|uniref:Uncharacterized protein n=1 Tax=Dyella solisilvae TaxID=1920168 RepID=A0A370K6J1_9GAMM|nr:hypothetical protein [Dyella solisilvae]RDI98266.1 hypothetical protein DVT68_14430 [Dyella solisilvae]
MGFFGDIGSGLARAQAAAVIELLLARQVEYGVLEGQPRELAEHLVSQVWAQRPTLFEGKPGPRPHKLAVAAIALAAGIRHEAYRANAALQDAYTLALGHVLEQVASRAADLNLHDIDQRLLDLAAATFFSYPGSLPHEPHLDWFGL